MKSIFTLFSLFFLVTSLVALGQNPLPAYTAGNTLLISIESQTGRYEYVTNQMLVRYNENSRRVECLFDVNSLLPANDSSPVVLAQDIFFAAKYPEQLIEIDALDANAQVSTSTPNLSNRKARIMFHSVPIDLTIPVSFSPDRRNLLFNTTFDILLPEYRIGIPAKYIPRLTGRITYTIRNAQWTYLQSR